MIICLLKKLFPKADLAEKTKVENSHDPSLFFIFFCMKEKLAGMFKEIKRLTKKAFFILRTQGLRALAVRLKNEIYACRSRKEQEKAPASVKELLYNHFPNLQPVRYLKVKRENLRLNIVTDSLNKDSMFGGVATSLVLATLFSNRYKIPLRIITRTAKSNPLSYSEFLELFNLERPLKVEFFSDFDRNSGNNHHNLELSDKDIFLATSWWTAAVVKKMNLRKKFFYILQEVEEFFYPNGDEQYLCRNILKDKNIDFIVNSKLLFDYYGIMGYENILRQGKYFEPAFPEHIYSDAEGSSKNKSEYKLFFYSRPNNPRNLFYSGLKIIDEALLRNIIDTKEWKIYFAGSDVPRIKFTNGAKPTVLGHMDWSAYSKFIKNIDLGFCLMYTPHPSYPPLDIASSGGVVLTNKYANKTHLDYSKNIICEDLDIESMMKGFAKAVELAKNGEERHNNYMNNKIERSWEKSFEGVLSFMKENV